MHPDKIKQRVQIIVVSCSVILLIAKFTAYFLTNSVGILTDAMESIVNVSAGFISLYSLRMAAKPKDQNHPFGHGKIELVSASIEGGLIIFAGGLIIYQGIERLLIPSDIQKMDIGILVVAVSGLINYLLGRYSIHQGKRFDSIALVSGGKHLLSDTYSTIGLVAGLLLLYITGLAWIDSLLAFIFGCIIIVTGINILRNTVKGLIDTVDTEVLGKIETAIVENRKDDWINIHNLKTIKSGGNVFIDCDLTLPWYYNITEGHDSCEELRMSLESKFPLNTLVSIHSDSCLEKYCSQCQVANCLYRKEAFETPALFTRNELIAPDENETA